MPIWFDFDKPAFLWLLLILPVWAWMTRRSLAAMGRTRRIVAVAVRSIVAAILILTLARVRVVRHTDDQAVIVVVDESSSIPKDQLDGAWKYIHDAAKKLRPTKDKIGVVRFDGDAVIDQMPTDALSDQHTAAPDMPRYTNIDRAIRLAMAMFLPERAKRILLVSDGNQNVGDAADCAKSLAEQGIETDVLPVTYNRKSDVLFEKMATPGRVALGEACELSFVLRADAPVTGRLRLYQNGKPYRFGDATSSRVSLNPGLNRLSLEVVIHQPGTHRFRAVFEPDNQADDAILQNDEARAFVTVPGRERLLIVYDDQSADAFADAKSAERLGEAFQRQGGDCDIVPVSTTHLDIPFLDQYPTVVLSNVAATSLTSGADKTLLAYVRDLGGGLVAVGGNQSFTMGGYQNTHLEELLPVQTPHDREMLSSIGVVLVIDRSGSMVGPKIEQAKKAAVRVARMLNSFDKLGIVGFDFGATWVRPFGPAASQGEITSAISRISAGGGTNLYPAMQIASGALLKHTTDVSHMIVLTDGQSMPGDFLTLASNLKKVGVTVSTVAVGADADLKLLKDIADRAGGRHYLVENALKLPQIFTREVALVGRRGMYEGAFDPKWHAAIEGPVSMSQREKDAPALYGTVITEAKAGADVSMVREHDKRADPVLAHWRFGLGKSVAFLSGSWSNWGRDWASWSGFSRFWTRVFRWAARSVESDSSLQMRVEQQGASGKVVIETQAGDKAASPLASISAGVVTPSGDLKPVHLKQTSAGTFEGEFPATEPGTYLVQSLTRRSNGVREREGRASAGFSVSYSPEFREQRSNTRLLEDIADETSGRVLDKAQPEMLFDPSRIRGVDVPRNIVDFLLYATIGVFLFDVFVRRVRVDPAGALAKAAANIRSRARVRSPKASKATGALKNVREELLRKAKTTPNEPASPGNLPTAAPTSTARPTTPTVAQDKSTPTAPPPFTASPELRSLNDATPVNGLTPLQATPPTPASSNVQASRPPEEVGDADATESSTARLLKFKKRNRDR